MKRIVASVTGFLLILATGIAGCVWFDKTCTEIESSINESIRLTEQGQYAEAATVVQNTENFWEECHPLLSLYINHSHLYEISIRLTGLAQLSAEESKEEFLSGAEQAIQALEYVMSDK